MMDKQLLDRFFHCAFLFEDLKPNTNRTDDIAEWFMLHSKEDLIDCVNEYEKELKKLATIRQPKLTFLPINLN